MAVREPFEWDEQKAIGNLQKHGISFERAALAFSDALGIELIDDRQEYGEERIQLIARESGELLTIIYTERGSHIRIISARRASTHERNDYYRQNAG